MSEQRGTLFEQNCTQQQEDQDNVNIPYRKGVGMTEAEDERRRPTAHSFHLGTSPQAAQSRKQACNSSGHQTKLLESVQPFDTDDTQIGYGWHTKNRSSGSSWFISAKVDEAIGPRSSGPSKWDAIGTASSSKNSELQVAHTTPVTTACRSNWQ